MAANRLRSTNWRDTLCQIASRGGAIEIAVQPEGSEAKDNAQPQLFWRVRLLSTADNIVVEQPNSLGDAMPFTTGVDVSAVMSVGQNRWTFRTSVVSKSANPPSLTLKLPESVQRVSRRSEPRYTTSGGSPIVRVAQIEDRATLIAAETAIRERFAAAEQRGGTAPTERSAFDEFYFPTTITGDTALLENIGGGGVGLVVPAVGAGFLDQSALFWLGIDLSPILPAPLGIAARLAHRHLDSAQRIHAGFAFELGHCDRHKAFVTRELRRYVAAIIAAGRARAA